MPPLIELRVEEPIAYVTICRPRYRNAVTRAMTKDIEDAFYQAQDDPRVKIIVLQGQGEHFSSGHDLGTPEAEKEAEIVFGKDQAVENLNNFKGSKHYEDRYRWDIHSCLRLREITKPTIASIRGYCIFHGWALASVMDIIFASEESMILPAFTEYFDLPWRVGSRKAKEFLFQGPTFLSGSEALEKGLINRCVPDKDLEKEVVAYAHKVAKRSSFTLRMIKEACNESDSAKNFETYIRQAFSHWVHMSNDLPPLKPGVKSIIGKENVEKARSKM